MVTKITFSQKALINTIEIIEWYDKQSKGLGSRFFQALQKGYKIILKNPYFQIRYKDVRCLPLEKFPYMIHFIVEDEGNRTLILGIKNSHQDPKTWEDGTDANRCTLIINK